MRDQPQALFSSLVALVCRSLGPLRPGSPALPSPLLSSAPSPGMVEGVECMVPCVSTLPWIPSVSRVKGTGRGLLGREQGGLTLHLLCKAVHVIGLIGVTDAVGSHARKLILVSIAAFPRNMDGVPARNRKWGVSLGDRGVLCLCILLPCGRKQ